MNQDNKILAQKFLHLTWNQGDFSQISDLAAENFYYKTTFTDDILSLSEYLEFINTFKTAIPDLLIHTEESMSEDDRVMTHVSFSGVVAKPVYGIPVSDKIITFEAMSLWDIKNGRVASLNTLIDIGGIERQLNTRLPRKPLSGYSSIQNAS